MTRAFVVSALLASLWPSAAAAQALSPAPIVLGAAPGARATALGGAWVAGRDQDVVFANPAQIIGARPDFAVTLSRFGPGENSGAFATTYAAGKMSFTLGVGLQFVNSASRQTSLAVVDGAVTYKTFRIGAGVKYAANGTTETPHTILVDLGVGRTLFGGVAGFAMQNIGTGTRSTSPAAQLKRQASIGWSTAKPAGPLDLALFTQVTARSHWVGPSAGLEAGYSWIDGYSIALRAGAHRPDDLPNQVKEKPFTLGAAFTGDRLTMEYAVRFFDGSRHAQLVTIRWR